MKNKSSSWLLPALGALTILATVPAQASILLPGDSKLPDLFVAAPDALMANNSTAFDTATYPPTLNAAVFLNTVAKIVCPAAGCVDLYYQLTNLSGLGPISESLSCSASSPPTAGSGRTELPEVVCRLGSFVPEISHL